MTPQPHAGLEPILRSLPVLIVSPHARCNCRCMMCDIWKRTDNDKLTLADLEECLDEVQNLGLTWVVFSGGEPLMHPHLFEMCQMLRCRGIRVSLLTTGLMVGKYAGQITTFVDDIILSLDGPRAIHDAIRRVTGAFDLIEHGTAELMKIKPSFHISARCTVQQTNHDHLLETAECAQRLGLRSISFLAADISSEAFNRPNRWPESKQRQIALTLDQISTLEEQLYEIASRWKGTGFVLDSCEKLARIVDIFRSYATSREPQAPHCNAPWVSAVVEADGNVRPCFFHPPIGSLKHHTLLQILNGPAAVVFRQSLRVSSNPICRRCVCSLNWKNAAAAED
jgi:MoaA/NifB/PqqE/SkfB family radical SAM enzyme